MSVLIKLHYSVWGIEQEEEEGLSVSSDLAFLLIQTITEAVKGLNFNFMLACCLSGIFQHLTLSSLEHKLSF